MERKYSQETIRKIERNAKLYKCDGNDVNSMSEEFYYSSKDTRGITMPFCPILAGITHPSKAYFCVARKTDPFSDHFFVLEYIVKGKGYIEIGDEKYTVKAGDTYLLNRPAPAKWYADPDDPYEKKWINFTGRFPEGLMYTYNMTDRAYVVELDSEDKFDEIHQILLHYNIANPREDNRKLMHLILDLIGQIHTVSEQNKKTEKVNFKQILEYIANNIMYDSLSPSTICLNFYISERTLIRLFAKNIGISPAKYILLQRTDMAKRLLTETDLTIDKISASLHFSGTRHFRRAFEEYCGVSPSEWRKQNKK